MSKKKILGIEIGFFIFYFFVFDILTRLQLNYTGVQKNDVIEGVLLKLLYLPVDILYFLFYWFCIKRYLLNRKWLKFAATVIVFIAAIELLLPILDRSIAHASFLPSRLRANASTVLDGKQLFPRQMISLTLMHLVTMSGLAYLIKTIQDEVQMRRLKEQQLQLQLNSLKNQLHPHFFFNTLNNIYSLALHNSSKTAGTIAKLGELMRYVIYECKNDKVLLPREIEFIENFIELERIRHVNACISFCTQGNMSSIEIEPLLFLPLLENAFKHGLQNGVGRACVEAALVVLEKEVIFEIENSRPKFNEHRIPGIGVINLKKRLELLYYGRHTLNIRADEKSYKATLTLML
jgi:LytS/YehU family sensor histidine kinase